MVDSNLKPPFPPETGNDDRAVEDGVVDLKESLLSPKFYYSPGISREKTGKNVDLFFTGRMDCIYPCHEFDERIALFHKGGMPDLCALFFTEKAGDD